MGKRAVVLVIALLLAGAAAFAIFQYLSNIDEEYRTGQEQVQVFRALRPIDEGTEGNSLLTGGLGILYEDSFEQRQDLPADAITTESDLQNILSGTVAVGPISENGILTRSQWVAPTVQLTPLADLLQTGMQAITISPGDIQGVNGFANPGDHINVIVTLSLEASLTGVQQPSFGIPGDTGDGTDTETETATAQVEYTRFVLQNLLVLAVGNDLVAADDAGVTVEADGSVSSEGQATGEVQGEEQQGGNSTVYTLAVDPNQAERLVYAMQNGAIYLTLVPPGFEEVDTRGITIENLFEGDLLTDIFGN
jgi:pilus assembly protein CpaB